MSADYPSAQEHLVPRSFMFNSNAKKAVVIHKTGGDATPAAVYNTFINSGNPGKSSHYAIGQDGSIWQFVPESLGAGANGITDSTTDPFWYPYIRQYGNLNTCTISIEHCDPSSRNDTPLTPAQKQASFALVAHLCGKYGIPADHIKPHRSIVSTDCPGTYPMAELINFVQQGGTSVQQYSEHSTDFGSFFVAVDGNHWKCIKTGKVVQFGIKTFFSTLSMDGNTLPIVGLPLSDEIQLTVNGKPVVLQVFERAGIYYDTTHAKDKQPGTGVCELCHLNDPDFIQHVPGLPTLPAQPMDTTPLLAAINAIPDAIAQATATAVALTVVEAKKL